MNWADFKIAVAQGLVASAESVANIISGTTKVGNADKVDGYDSSSLYKVTVLKSAVDVNTLVDEGNYFLINGRNVPESHGFLSVRYYNGGGFAPNASWGATKCVRQTYYHYNNSAIIRTRCGMFKSSVSTDWEWTDWVLELSSGNSVPVVVSTTAPTDTTAVWIVP